MTDWRPSQRVWLLDNGLGHRRNAMWERTVVSVGRRWVKLDSGDRFDRFTGMVDAGPYTDTVRAYPSLEDAQLELRTRDAWSALQRGWQCVRRPSLEAIQAAAAALGIDLDRAEGGDGGR